MDSSSLLGSVSVAVKADLSQLVADFARGRSQTQAFANDMNSAVAPTRAMTSAQQALASQLNGVIRQYEPMRTANEKYAADLQIVQKAQQSGLIGAAESAALQGSMARAMEDTTKKIEGQSEGLEGMARSMEHHVRAFRLLFEFLGVELVLRLGEFALKTLEATGKLEDQAKQLGLTTAQLQEYNYVATQTGTTGAELQKGFGFLRNELNDAAAGRVSTFSKLMQKLGIDVKQAAKDAADGKLDEVVKKVIDGLGQVGNKAQQQAAGVIAFGESFKSMGEMVEQGSGGISRLQQEARQLGLVLSDEQIRTADETSKKLQTLWAVLQIKFATTVVDNAQAIEHLATALANFVGTGITRAVEQIGALIQRLQDLATAAGEVMDFLNRLSGGNGVTAPANAAAKTVLGGILTSGTDAQGNLQGTDAYGNYFTTAPSRTRGLGQVASMHNGQASNTISLGDPSTNAPPKAKGPNIDLSNLLSPKGKKGAQPKFDQFQSEMAQEAAKQLQLEHDATDDIVEQNRLEKEIIDQKQIERDRQIDRQVKNKELTAKEGEQLKHQIQITTDKEREAADQKLRIAQIEAANQFADELAKLDQDGLATARQLARTDAQRKTIDLAILDSKQQQVKAELQKQIDIETDKKNWQRVAELTDEMAKLEANQVAEIKAFNIEHLNAMQQFQYKLPATADEFNDQIKSMAFDQFNQKLQQAGQFASDLGDDFGKAAADLAQFNPRKALQDLITDLAQTFTQNFIEKPVADYVTAHLGVPLAKQAFGGQLDKLAKQAGGTALTTTQMNTALAQATQSLYVLMHAAQSAASALGSSTVTGSGGPFSGSSIANLFGAAGGGSQSLGSLFDLSGGLSLGSATFSGADLGSALGSSFSLGSVPFAGFGFASGGYTGLGNDRDVKGVVHANEFVVHADAVRKVGLPYLHSLNAGSSMVDRAQPRGFAVGGFAGPAVEGVLPGALPTLFGGSDNLPAPTGTGTPSGAGGSMDAAAAMLMQAAQMLMQFAQQGGKGGGLLTGLLGVAGGMLLGGGKGNFLSNGLASLFGGGKSLLSGGPLSLSGLGMGTSFSGASLGGLGGGSFTLGSAGFSGFGFDHGGFTGSGADTDVKGFVHANEYVWDADTTRAALPILQMIGSGRLPTFAGPGMNHPLGRAANSNQPLALHIGELHLHGVADERTARQSANQFLGHIQQRTAHVVKKGLNK